MELLRLAASWGSSNAAYSLGALYRNRDNGIPQDLEESRRWFRLAKELGCESPVDEFLE